MPRKFALSPLQAHVLRILEEAGEETIGTVKATLNTNNEVLDREVAGLVRLELVQRSTQDGRPSLLLTARGGDALTT